MKAIRIRPAKTVHPEYFVSQNRPDRESVPRFMHHDVGEVVELPDVASMCLGPDPYFAPYDDECRAAVEKLLNSPQRVGELNRLKTMYANRSQLSEGAKKYVEAIFGKHQAEIENSTPAQQSVTVRKRSDAVPAPEPTA